MKRLEWLRVDGVPLPLHETAQIQSWATKAHAMHPDYTVRLWMEGVDSVGEAAGGLRGAGVDIQSLNRNYNLPSDHKLYTTNTETGSDQVRQAILETGGVYLDPDVDSNTLHVQALERSKPEPESSQAAQDSGGSDGRAWRRKKNWKEQPIMRRSAFLASLGLGALLLGCANTQVELSGATPNAPLCQPQGEKLSALVLWGPIWRPDQKDVPLREQAAQYGLEDFLATSGCFAEVEIRRLPGGSLAIVPTHQELLSLASMVRPRPDRVLVITVRELGPILKLLSSAAAVEGGTEVVLGLNAVDVSTGASLASFQTHWRNGGPMVIKGVASLPQDMSDALRAALSPAPLLK